MDTPLLVLARFSNCSVPEFFNPLELMLNTERFVYLENNGDRRDIRKCLERVKNLTLLASNSFHSLNVSNQLNIPSNNQYDIDKRKGQCDNCSGEHYAPYFPHSRDKAMIKKATEKRTACRGGSGSGCGRGGGCQCDRKKWIKRNDNRDGDINDYVNGVQKRGNDWMRYCRHQ